MPNDDINKLFSETLIGDYDDDAPWEAVHALRRIGSREVFEWAAKWCASASPLVRTRGVDVLAQLGKTADHPTNNFPEESYAIVVGLLKNEQNVRALNSEIVALGHLGNTNAIPLIVDYRHIPPRKYGTPSLLRLEHFPMNHKVQRPCYCSWTTPTKTCVTGQPLHLGL